MAVKGQLALSKSTQENPWISGVTLKSAFSLSLSKYLLNLFNVPDLSPSLRAPDSLIGQTVLSDSWLLLLTQKVGFYSILIKVEQSGNAGFIPESKGFIAIAFQI